MLDISDGSRALGERAAVKMGSEVIEPAESQARRWVLSQLRSCAGTHFHFLKLELPIQHQSIKRDFFLEAFNSEIH